MVTGNREYFEEVLETLEPFGDITGKAMFGGYGFWDRGDMFALISSAGTLYFKADDATAARYVKAKSKQFAPEMRGRPAMAMPYWTVPKAVFADDTRLAEWVADAIAVAHATSKKNAKKATAKKAATKKAPAEKSAAKKSAAKTR